MASPRMSGVVLVALFLFPALLVGCTDSDANKAQAKKPPEAIAVRVAPVASRSMAALYRTSATLRPEKRATVPARTRGVIEGFSVEEGDAVRAGQALVRLEDTEQKIELAGATSNLSEKERAFRRSQKLHKKNALSFNDLEKARRALDDAKQRSALAKLALDRTTIRAPFAGRIVKRHLDPGAMVSDGKAVLELADLDPLLAEVSVPERHVVRLEVGQSVRLQSDAGQVGAAATIARIAPVVDPSTGTVKVTVRVESKTRLRSGAFVRVEIVTDTRVDALVVPRTALVARGGRWHLFRIDGSGERAEKLQVRTGFEEGSWVELREVEGELRAGDRVVVVGAAALSDGARIKIEPAR